MGPKPIGTVLEQRKPLARAGIRTLECPAHSESLNRLSRPRFK